MRTDRGARRVAAGLALLVMLACVIAGCATGWAPGQSGGPVAKAKPSTAQTEARAAAPKIPAVTTRTLGLNWFRISMALLVPTVLGTLVAGLIWTGSDATMGSVIGAGVIVLAMLLFFSGEYIEVLQFKMACTAAAARCKMTLSEFSRYGIYGIIGFVEAAVVFTIGLRIEERRRRNGQ